MATYNQRSILSKGIYHGLPDLSDCAKGLTAIVTGANGISGAHMIRVLSETPERWTKIYALSRRPPSGEWPKQVEHVPLDFLKSPEEIAGVLKERGIKADYVFFFSYVLVTDKSGALQWGDPELVRVNDLILTNFLEAIPLASWLPKRIFIQFGGKYYGVHLGPTAIPDEETDPRLTVEPNLYYTQEDILTKFCQKHNIHWNSGLPSFILGAALDSAQSLLFPILVYVSVQKYLNQPLIYPADLQAWESPQSLSSAVLNSYLFEWAVLTDGVENQAFNASDDCAFTWGKFWPRLAEFYGMGYTGPDTSEGAQFYEKGMKYEPPPRGFGPRGKQRFKFSFVEWANRPEVIKAWKELATKHGLREGELRDVGSVFGRADFAILRTYSNILSATKAKKAGFFGFVDSYESIFSVIKEFIAMKIIPPI